MTALFKNNNGAKAHSSVQQQVVEQLVHACQKVDLYLNSSPSEPQCFITHKAIAEAHDHSPVFEMAKSLGDPHLIKRNVTKVVTPLLICLRSFIDAYSAQNNNEIIVAHFTQLLALVDNARAHLLKQKDTNLLDVIKNIHQQLADFAVNNFPGVNLAQATARNNPAPIIGTLAQIFTGETEKQRKREAEFLEQAQLLLDGLEAVKSQRTVTAHPQPG